MKVLREFGPATALLVLILGLGLLGFGGARWLFVAGCLAVSFDARKAGAAVHFQTMIILFCFSPLLRRIVDMTSGYDQIGIILTGPFLALLVPTPALLDMLKRGGIDRPLRPFVTVGLCVGYAAGISIFVGDFKDVAINLLKWMTPLAYGAWLYHQTLQEERVAEQAGRVFLFLLPVLGAYGIYQYVDPPLWDLYWMAHVPYLPVGEGVPYGVRVFSTMNYAASFATFAVAGILYVCIVYPGWLAGVATVLVSIAVLLSSYRSAWIGMLFGLLVCFVAASTRVRALVVIVAGLAIVSIASTTPPFDLVVSQRLESFSKGTADYSASERLDEYEMLSHGTVWGYGFSNPNELGGQGVPLVDGQVIISWGAMGIGVGLICCIALVWAAVRGIRQINNQSKPAEVALAAITASIITQIMLAIIASGEIGFLYWSYLGIAAAYGERQRAVTAFRTPVLVKG